MKTGIVSATFRDKSIEEIIALTKEAGLDAVEWSGDVHVPPGDLDNARQVGVKTREAGLLTPSYASYYRAGANTETFGTIIETTLALGAKNIRVWAGEKGSAEADASYTALVQEDCKRIAALAKEHGLTVSVEYHGNTLTDTPRSVRALLESTDDLYSYWQLLDGRQYQEETEEIRYLGRRLSNVHVQYMQNGHFKALSEGKTCWAAYIACLKQLPG